MSTLVQLMGEAIVAILLIQLSSIECWSRRCREPPELWISLMDRSMKYGLADSREIHAQPLSLPRSLTAWPYFCNFVISASPCFTTSVYCRFLSSGRLVSMMEFTRSMVHGIRSAAMNLARSLREICQYWPWRAGEGRHLPVEEVDRDPKVLGHTPKSHHTVGL